MCAVVVWLLCVLMLVALALLNPGLDADGTEGVGTGTGAGGAADVPVYAVCQVISGEDEAGTSRNGGVPGDTEYDLGQVDYAPVPGAVSNVQDPDGDHALPDATGQ